jgi:hypothetical protein
MGSLSPMLLKTKKRSTLKRNNNQDKNGKRLKDGSNGEDSDQKKRKRTLMQYHSQVWVIK